jgi:hypothetical protein
MATTFTYTTPGEYDPETGIFSVPTTATVVGVAIRVRGDPEIYKRLGLVEAESPTLLFVPTTYGETPAVGWTTTWNSTAYTVRAVYPTAPDGVVIMTKVVLER